MKETSEQTLERYKREYIIAAPNVFSALEIFDNESPYSCEYRNKHFPFWYMELSLSYHSYCEGMVSDFRKRNSIALNCSHAKEILRLRHMLNHYDRVMYNVEYPEDEASLLKVMLGNSQWEKISRQSHKILELLRRR